MEHRPDARVVINSLFPMTTIRGGSYPVISDFEDSFNHRYLRLFKQKSKPTPAPIALSEEDSSEAAEREEELRNEQAKKDQRRKHMHGTAKNPVMLDQSKMHKYKYGTPFVAQTDKPLWTSIRAINKELRKFAEKNEHVYFFDATDLFTEKTEKNAYKLQTDRISIRGHPTEIGFQVWEVEMVKMLNQILATMKREQPELFKSPVSSGVSGGPKDPIKANIDDDVALQEDNDEDLDETIIHGNDDGFYRNAEAEEAGILHSSKTDDEDDEDDGYAGGSLVVPDD